MAEAGPYSQQSLEITAETILYPGFLLSHHIWRLPQKSLDLLDAYRYYLDIAELRYPELSISLTEKLPISVHRETVE